MDCGGEYSTRNDDSARGLNAYRGFLGALWNPTAQLGHDFRIGFEQREFVTSSEKSKGVFVEATSQWRPSPLTEMRGVLGYHYYGTTGQISAKIRGNRSAFELSVGRQLVNSQESTFFPQTDSPLGLLDRYLSGTISDPTARAQEVVRLAGVFGLPSQIDSPRYFYVDRFVLEQSARFSGVYTLPRISFNGLVGYRKTTPGLSQLQALSLQFSPPTTELQATAGAAYRLSESASLRLELQGTRTERDDSALSANRFRTQVTLSQIWSKAISTGATAFYERQRSDVPTGNISDRGLGVFARYAFN